MEDTPNTNDTPHPDNGPGPDESGHYKITEDDRCPNCGAGMPATDAVVCLNCGYDQVSNRIIKPKVGTVEVEEPGSDAEKFFVKPGRFGWQAPVIAGLALIVTAAILSGVHAEQRAIGRGVATLLYGPIYAGLGVAAVMLTAFFLEQKLGRLEHAVGRMLVAVGAAGVCWHAAYLLDVPNALRFFIGAGAGAGLYYLIIWLTFRLDRAIAGMLMTLHLAVWLVFRGLLALEAWLASGQP